ncbi:MAG TPA: hypothetical protein VGM27_00845 [Acidobacteriaceae bacterium]|jgi:hypothetical protein
MPGPFPPQINWQPIDSLPLIGSMVDGLLDEVERQYSNLASCRLKPHVLDDYTVDRVLKVYSDQAKDVDLYEEQLSRWSKLDLASAQRREVARLTAHIPAIRSRIAEILTLAKELKQGTIETILAKSDYEVGLDFLLGKRKP